MFLGEGGNLWHPGKYAWVVRGGGWSGQCAHAGGKLGRLAGRPRTQLGDETIANQGVFQQGSGGFHVWDGKEHEGCVVGLGATS